LANALKKARRMIRRFPLFAAVLLLASAARAQWNSIGPGVDFEELTGPNYDIYVTRIDLTNTDIRVIATRDDERGLKVSDFAKREKAIAAINGDYFDDKFNPIGLAIGPCGSVHPATKDPLHEQVVTVGAQHAAIERQSDVAPDDDPIDAAISGWPVLVRDCTALSATELPGSAAFTRSPHPRTAVGISSDGKTLYFVVADGRRTGVPGMTLAQLGQFMADKLHVCSAINLDGGGSTAMWVRDRIVNRPSDGVERPVGDHLAVVLRSDLALCGSASQ
jgi:exopolysaccharide biosynthesis protein